ncbi:MAG: chemotaxis-specific protein-glutamate methyltransferase CheB [Gammaproteobacteria bacterium]|nr:chemotaxis-specific protein-glutamate methyltransferase CheB [Gammaproteobacteria bacterium]
MIKVLLVDDSPLVLVILKRMLRSSDSDIEVVGTAANGADALRQIPLLNPQVICTDFHMPVMDGLQFTREVMAHHPRPILVISISVHKGKNDANIFQFLEAGAIDVFPKPAGGLECDFANLSAQLIRKIRVLSGVMLFTRHSRDMETAAPAAKPAGGSVGMLDNSARVLAIGASTGGPQALHTILSALPQGFPVPVICVQHISEGFLQELIDWLGAQCALSVRIAKSGEHPQPSTVYFPPENYHLTIDRHGRFSTPPGMPNELHKPSVTVTFNAIAQYYGKYVIGVLLTGMGRDGADGMQSIHQAGGVTIAEDESSCIVFGMPKEAIALGAAKHVWPLPQIARTLGSLK